MTDESLKPSQSVIVHNWFEPYVHPCDFREPGSWEQEVRVTVTDGSGIERFRGALSDREFEVAQLVSESYSPRKAAKLLGISHRTVRTHLKSIRRKLCAFLQKTCS